MTTQEIEELLESIWTLSFDDPDQDIGRLEVALFNDEQMPVGVYSRDECNDSAVLWRLSTVEALEVAAALVNAATRVLPKSPYWRDAHDLLPCDRGF